MPESGTSGSAGGRKGQPLRSTRLHLLLQVRTEQERAMQGTATDPFDQAPDQRHVAVLADFTTEPQAGLHRHGHRHPHHGALFLDPNLVGLNLSEITRLLHQKLVDGLTLTAGSGPPMGNCAFIESKSRHNRL